MLENSEKQNYCHIVSWMPHGRAFKIHKEDEFITKIMPRYFKAKIGSFRRWLRAWGFCRITEGKDRGAWYHQYFVRGVTSLCQHLSRQQMLKAMEDWLPAGQVPDFYAPASGNALSETPNAVQADANEKIAKNPKRLRGVMLEDLRNMLQETEDEGNAHIVSWLPHGRAFKVHLKDEFSSNIMPRYFKATKYVYFCDTLRIWGFDRLKKGTDKGGYYHRYFVKGNPGLSRHLSRQQMRDSMAGWSPVDGEPDFLAMDADTLVAKSLAAPPPPPAKAAPQKKRKITPARAPALPVPPVIIDGEPSIKPREMQAPSSGEKRKHENWETVAI
jgi:hypothetical protein